MSEDSVKVKLNPVWTGIILAPVIALMLLDFFVLRGETIYSKTGIRFESADMVTVTFPVTEPNRKHTLKLGSSRYSISLGWSLYDPDDNEIASDNEYGRHKGTRRANFTPTQAGDYVLEIERRQASRVIGKTRDAISIYVLLNDRQILSPLLDWFKF